MNRKKIYFSQRNNKRDPDLNTVIIKKQSNKSNLNRKLIKSPVKMIKSAKKNIDLLNSITLVERKHNQSINNKFKYSKKRIKSAKKRIKSAKKNINIGQNMFLKTKSDNLQTKQSKKTECRNNLQTKQSKKTEKTEKNKQFKQSKKTEKTEKKEKNKQFKQSKISDSNIKKQFNEDYKELQFEKKLNIKNPLCMNNTNISIKNHVPIRYYQQKDNVNNNKELDLISVSLLKEKLNSKKKIVSDQAPKKLIKDLFIMLDDDFIKINLK
jgi:hypothetical protein